MYCRPHPEFPDPESAALVPPFRTQASPVHRLDTPRRIVYDVPPQHGHYRLSSVSAHPAGALTEYDNVLQSFRCSHFHSTISEQHSQTYVYSHRYNSRQNYSATHCTYLLLHTVLSRYIPERVVLMEVPRLVLLHFPEPLLVKAVLVAEIELETHRRHHQSTETLKSSSKLPIYRSILPSKS